MKQPLKAFSQIQIEEAIGKALGELTGAEYEVSIHKIESRRELMDHNTIELTVKSNYSAVLEAWQSEDVVVGEQIE